MALTRTRIERSKEDDILLRMSSDRKLKVGTQYSECLVDDITLACLHYHLTNLLWFLPELDALLQSWHILAADREWNLAQEWHDELLEILTATNGGVCLLTDIDHDNRNEETQDKGDEHNLATNWCHRVEIACWRGNHTGIISGERLGKLVLLTLLEKEEIQCLLYFLLTTHSLQVLRLDISIKAIIWKLANQMKVWDAKLQGL